jgi:hypothetical protein
MSSITPKATGVVNIPGPLTRHASGQVFTIVGVAGTAGTPTVLDYTTATAWNASTTSRDTVDISAIAPAALQVFNLGTSAIFVSIDGEDPTIGEASPIAGTNGYQFDMPSASLSIAIWSATGGEAFCVRAFMQAVLA